MDIATTLLEYGADANAVTRQGIAPVHLASQDGHVDMVSLLLSRNANVNLSNKVSVPLPGDEAQMEKWDEEERALRLNFAP